MKYLGFTFFVLIVGAIVVLFFALNVTERVQERDRFSMEVHQIENHNMRRARCNDGTAPVYYHRPASEGFEDKWVIWFEGGGGCTDQASCFERMNEDPGLVSTKDAPESMRSSGILSTNLSVNPDFADWNHVMFKYCSSDNWTGDAVRKVAGHPWFFEGKNIVTAFFEDLSRSDLYGDHTIQQASEVLVTGTSAGGGGVAQNINDIASWLPVGSVTAVIDSSWEVPGATVDMNEEELADFFDRVIDYRGAQLESTCMAGVLDHPSECQYISTIYDFFTVPAFIYIDQYDRSKLENRFGVTNPKDPDQRELIGKHAQAIRDSLDGLDGVFSPAETWHGALTNKRFNSIKIDGYSFQEVLGNWYFGYEGPTRLLADPLW